MLRVDGTDPIPAAALDVPGGFAWWYVDGRDDAGHGLVLIASWALPFFPGDRAARDAGRPLPARARPGVNLALYRAGRAVAYALHDVDPADASWDGERMRLGRSVLTLERRGPRAELHATVDLPVAGSAHRLVGEVRCQGALADDGGADPGEPHDHRWAPVLGAARIRATFTHAGRTVLDLDGSGYHDRNVSGVPLDALGIDVWTWGRQAFGDRLVIHYLTWPKAGRPELLLVVVEPDGRRRVARDVPVRRVGARRTWLGVGWWEEIHTELDGRPLVVRYAPPVDTGPFYLRFQTTATWGDAHATGWAELCVPDRIDLARHRPLVRMCVQREAGPQSLWLPLFSGPVEGRLARLGAWWTGGAR